MIRYLRLLLLPIIALCITLCAYSSQLVFADGSPNPLTNTCNNVPGATKSQTICPNGQPPVATPIGGPGSILAKVIQVVSFIAGVAGVIMIIVGGLEYIMSSGDSNRTNTAKNTIIYALVGLVIAASAQAILYFVIGKV